MIKLNKKTYRGIEYVNLKSLSAEQSTSLRQSLTNRTLINILQNEVVVSDCILYSAYEAWYDSIVTKPEAKAINLQPKPELPKQAVLIPA